MNIFLDKIITKKNADYIKIIRAFFIISFFGGISFFQNNQLTLDILIIIGIFCAGIYTVLKIINDHKRKEIIQ